jgi:putative redox protein
MTLGMGRTAAGMLPELAEQISHESGWTVASGTMSGVGEATGTFSGPQWRADLAVMIERLYDSDRTLSLAGFGIGGSLSLRAAADDERVRGVATFATSADLAAWCGDAESFHARVMRAGVVEKSQPLPPPTQLRDGVMALDPRSAIANVPPRRLLIGHGADDREVPVENARVLFEAAEEHAELRIIQGAGHWLRADPRMVATLVGWMDRH